MNTDYSIGIKNRWFLNEERLGNYLTKLFPAYKFEHDKCVPGSGIRHRADYCSSELKLIVEFDGYQHFTQAKRIIADKFKNQIYEELGFSVIHIPYFVQISPDIIKQLFSDWFEYADLSNFESKFKQIYPHGFIDDSAYMIMPCDYCDLGQVNFHIFLEQFESLVPDISKSLKEKYQKILKKNSEFSMMSPGFLKSLCVPYRFEYLLETEEVFVTKEGVRLPTNSQLTEYLKRSLGDICDEHFSEYISEFEGKIIQEFKTEQGDLKLTVPTFTIKNGKIKILNPEIDYSLDENLICCCMFFKRSEHNCCSK